MDLFLFSTDREYVSEAVAAGVDGIVVDWEVAGKSRRQAGADTEVNHDTVDDLRRVREWVHARVLCRVNPPGPSTAEEVEAAIAAGADEVLVPMVRTREELERVIELVDGRCGVGALVETPEAVNAAADLATLPLSRLYLGLNDLSIERSSPSIFSAFADGTVEQVARAVSRPFGVAGLTDPACGAPIPCRLLLGELVRLGCDFTFLRRSYRRDAAPGEQAAVLGRIREALAAAASRSADEVEADRRALVAALAEVAA
jgi:citrate lyase beta subunit